MMQGFRDKYIQEYLEKIEGKKFLLSDWENEFVQSVKLRIRNKQKITYHQFNKLKEIAEKI